MVNFGSSFGRPLTLRERAEVLGISYERALFLVACAHDGRTHNNKGSFDREVSIPYDVAVPIKEAARLGINIKDIAEMMDMTEAEIAAYPFDFPEKTTAVRPMRGGFYNLLAHGDDPLEQ